MKLTKVNGTLIAAAAAAAFAVLPVTSMADSSSAPVAAQGANANSCKHVNKCKQQNKCKGMQQQGGGNGQAEPAK